MAKLPKSAALVALVLFPVAADASVSITNSQVYVLGSGYAGNSPEDTDFFTYTTPTTGTQTWTPSFVPSKDGQVASASSNLQSYVGASEFSFETIGGGMSWAALGGNTYTHLTLRLSMNFTVSSLMEADFLLGATISGNIDRSVGLVLREDSTTVVSLGLSAVGTNWNLSDEHLLQPGKSYYFAVTYMGGGYGTSFNSYSSSISNASGSMSVQTVPEPATGLLVALGAGVLLMRRKRA